MSRRPPRRREVDWDTLTTIGGLGVALIAPAAARRARRWFPPKVADAAVLGAVMGTGYVAVAILERRSPYRRSWATADGDEVTDLATLFVVSPIEGLLEQAFVGWLCTRLRGGRPPAAPARTWGGRLARLSAAVVLADFLHYWHHRWSHERPSLWRYHARHHDVSRLSWSNATRFHPVDVVPLAMTQDIPLGLMGIDAETVLSYRIVKTLHGLLQHANVPLGRSCANSVFSGAEQHRWHHSNQPEGRNANYGAVLSTFDVLFSTQYLGPDGFDGRIGPGRKLQEATAWPGRS